MVKFKSHLYYEDKDKVQETLKQLRPLTGSRIEYFKNGKSQGVAFTDIYAGSYFPSISIHKSATVSINFGPKFKFPEVLTVNKARGVSKSIFFYNFKFYPNLKIMREVYNAGGLLY